jgi:hypothetical protein
VQDLAPSLLQSFFVAGIDRNLVLVGPSPVTKLRFPLVCFFPGVGGFD